MPFLLYYTLKSRVVNQKSVLERTFRFQTCPSIIRASGRSIRYRQVLRTKQGSPFVPEKLVIEEKYPALYPTTIDTEIGEKMKAAILNEFEQWNSGYDAWAAYVDTMYDAGIEYDLSDEKMDREGFKAAMKEKVDNTKRVQINNILVSEDWAAIHFWDVTKDEAGEKTANNHMQFLHFVEDGDNVKVDMCRAK